MSTNVCRPRRGASFSPCLFLRPRHSFVSHGTTLCLNPAGRPGLAGPKSVVLPRTSALFHPLSSCHPVEGLSFAIFLALFLLRVSHLVVLRILAFFFVCLRRTESSPKRHHTRRPFTLSYFLFLFPSWASHVRTTEYAGGQLMPMQVDPVRLLFRALVHCPLKCSANTFPCCNFCTPSCSFFFFIFSSFFFS